MSEHVPCNRCGARLDVGETARFVTCNRCVAELAVRRTASSIFTEAMAESGTAPASAPPVPQDRDDERRELALARLDREWEMERQQYMIANRYGRRYVPTPAASVLAGAAAVGFGLVWTATAAQMGAAGDIFPLFGIVLILLGLGVSFYSYGKARQYQRAYDVYRRRRQAMLAGDDDE